MIQRNLPLLKMITTAKSKRKRVPLCFVSIDRKQALGTVHHPKKEYIVGRAPNSPKVRSRSARYRRQKQRAILLSKNIFQSDDRRQMQRHKLALAQGVSGSEMLPKDEQSYTLRTPLGSSAWQQTTSIRFQSTRSVVSIERLLSTFHFFWGGEGCNDLHRCYLDYIVTLI